MIHNPVFEWGLRSGQTQHCGHLERVKAHTQFTACKGILPHAAHSFCRRGRFVPFSSSRRGVREHCPTTTRALLSATALFTPQVPDLPMHVSVSKCRVSGGSSPNKKPRTWYWVKNFASRSTEAPIAHLPFQRPGYKTPLFKTPSKRLAQMCLQDRPRIPLLLSESIKRWLHL